MLTERLYWNDPLALSFAARVVGISTWRGASSLLLDRTAFYPESGGQMADRGVVGDARVVDVQVDEEGHIHHVLDAELPAVGSTVHGAVDEPRRRLHMAQHTGQHMLSRALLEVAEAATVSSRLGESGLTIDVGRPDVSEPALSEAERLVNELVDRDLPVRAWFPDAQELAALELRSKAGELRSKAGQVAGPVRVVQVEGFDAQPCGGTHCTHTSQVGMVRIVGTESHRGGLRIHFAAGARAREGLRAEAAILRSLASELTCGVAEVPAAMAKLRREAMDSAERAGQVTARLADELAVRLRSSAEQLPGQTEPVVIAVLDHTSELVRVLAARLCADAGTVVVLGARTPGGTQVVACRGEGSDFHCGAFIRRLAEQTGGRGGGRPERAEGRFSAELDAEAIRRALGG